jgi:hypothetical protein
VNGDYSATVSIDRATAEQDVADAEWILEQCKALTAS